MFRLVVPCRTSTGVETASRRGAHSPMTGIATHPSPQNAYFDDATPCDKQPPTTRTPIAGARQTRIHHVGGGGGSLQANSASYATRSRSRATPPGAHAVRPASSHTQPSSRSDARRATSPSPRGVLHGRRSAVVRGSVLAFGLLANVTSHGAQGRCTLQLTHVVRGLSGRRHGVSAPFLQAANRTSKFKLLAVVMPPYAIDAADRVTSNGFMS